MLSRLCSAQNSSKCLSRLIGQSRCGATGWDRRIEDNFKPLPHNKAETHTSPNRPYNFDSYNPDDVYYRLYIQKTGPREWGKFRMDFSGYEKALEVCKGGMANVATLPVRPGEFLDTSRAPRRFNDGKWWEKIDQEREFDRWKWYHPKLLPHERGDRPPVFLSANKAIVDIIPGTNANWSLALQLWKKEGRSQARTNFTRLFLSANARFKLWYHEGGFDEEKFIQDAMDTYILAHQAARDKNQELLKDTVLELESARFVARFSNYRQLWRCWGVTEKPVIMGRYSVRWAEFDDAVIVQIFVRIKTREEFVAYSRTGERVAGVEGAQFDKDQVVIFERIIEGGGESLTHCWRILQIIPASEIETWKSDSPGDRILAAQSKTPTD